MDSQAQRSIAGCLVVDREAKKWGQTQPTVCSFSSSQNSWMEHITGNPRQVEYGLGFKIERPCRKNFSLSMKLKR
ncbi:Labda-7,13-dienyl diphosphate synthase [Dirofilaria immitis]